MEKKNKKTKTEVGTKLVETLGKIECSTRGRKFEGYVIRKFDQRVTIRFERVKYIPKYERYAKSQTKLHARLPAQLKDSINLGDYVQVIECRPLSKIIHFIVVKKIRDADFKSKKIVEIQQEEKQKENQKENQKEKQKIKQEGETK